MNFEEMKGLTLSDITGLERGSESVVFTTECGRSFALYHSHDCCESVEIVDVAGDASDLIGSPLLIAEEVVSEKNKNPPDVEVPEYQDSFTWTFYKLATVKGYVTIRWYGASNGYYSETAYFREITSERK